MLFFLLNGLNKIHAFYQYSLNAFVTVFSRAIDIAPGEQSQMTQPLRACMSAPLLQASCTPCQKLRNSVRALNLPAGGRKQKASKVTLEQLTRRVTGEPKDFQEVMEMARRSSQGGGRCAGLKTTPATS